MLLFVGMLLLALNLLLLPGLVSDSMYIGVYSFKSQRSPSVHNNILPLPETADAQEDFEDEETDENEDDDEGLINKATIILPKAAFYVEYESETFGVQYTSQKLEEITLHEMGHAIGLGHGKFAGDLMSQTLSNEHVVNISECDVTGVLYANRWKLMNNDSEADNSKEDEVDC
jgi:hypothetical protein